MKIGVGLGHNAGVGGANGLVSEIKENRLYGYALMDSLRAAGHEVLDITPPRTSTSAEDLTYRVNKANAWGADLVISCHVNASGGNGAEVIFQPNRATSKAYADKVQAGFVALGFKNRGTYADVRGLYEIKHHNAPCIIIEPFFCDSAIDVALYKKIGYAALGKKIAECVTGKAINNVVASAPVQNTVVSSVDSTMMELQKTMNRLWFTDAYNRVLVCDGINGANTKAAVKKFQSAMGLTADGVAGAKTWSAINAIITKPVCKVGSSGFAVRYLQFRMGVGIDGKFGEVTKGKIMSYQHDCGLEQDGIVGKATWKNLIG